MLSAVEASQTANKEIFRFAQNDTEREVVILNGPQCSEVSHNHAEQRFFALLKMTRSAKLSS